MKSYRRYLSAAALAISLLVAPLTTAATRQDRDDLRFVLKEKIVRVIKQIQRIFPVAVTEDPSPPKP